MALFNANSNMQAEAEAMNQERRRAIVERALIPKLRQVFNKQARKSAQAYIDSEGNEDSVSLSFEDHQKDIMNVLVPAYAIIIERTVRYVLDEAGKSSIQKLETKKEPVDFVEEFIRSWVLTEALTQSTTIAETSFDLVRAAMVDGIVGGVGEREVGKAIFDSLGGSIATSRSKLIARTESHTVSQRSIIETVNQLNTPPLLKRWIPSRGERTRETHREMLRKDPIPEDSLFEVRKEKGGSDFMAYPGDPRGSAGNVINCRCAVTFKSRFN